MQSLAAECWRLAPETVNVDTTVGEIAWAFGPPQDEGAAPRKHRLWSDDGRVVAWGVINPPTSIRVSADRTEVSKAGLVWQVHPEHVDALDGILGWFAEETPGAGRQTSVRSTHREAIAQLEGHGFVYDPTAPWDLLNRRDLRDIAEPVVPDGYALKTMAEVMDVEKRVAVHRASWVDSSLNEDDYNVAMSLWPYRPEFDFVVEAPDGTLACSALGWYDEANRVGEFEPVGTHRDHRRLGLASNVMLFGMQRFQDAGATHSIVGCRGDDDYPIPKLVYHGIGFKEISRDMPYVSQP